MADDEDVDPFEQAQRDSATVEPDSAEDAAARAAEDAADQAAADAGRELVRGQLLDAARRLKPGVGYKQLIRQGCFAGLSDGQFESVLREINAATKTTLAALRKDKKDVSEEVAAAKREQRREEIERVRAQKQKAAAADPELARVEATYPLPKDRNYERTDGVIWAGSWVMHKNKEVYVPICSPFAIDALLLLHSGKEGLRIAVMNSSGGRSVIHVDRSDLGTSQGQGKVLSAMMGVGLRLASNKARDAVVDMLVSTIPSVRVTVVDQPGCYAIASQRCFVGPDGAGINVPPGHAIELSEHARLSSEATKRGTLDGWKETARMIVAVNEPMLHWRLALLAGAAGTLIDYVGATNAGVNIQGDSGIGKTLSLMLMASYWTSPDARDKGLLVDADATGNFSEIYAQRANGTACLIDELSHLTTDDLHKLIFSFAQGTGKRRMTRDAEEKQVRIWRSFLATTTERPIAQIFEINKARKTWTTGLAVRLPDLLFDPSSASKLPKSLVDEIERRIKRDHGWAGPAFVAEMLTYDPDSLARAIAEQATRIGSDNASATEERTCTVFAVIRVAGAIAVKAGLLPPEIDVIGTVDKLYELFLAGSGHMLNPSARAIDKLRSWLDQNWNLTVVSVDFSTGEKNRPVEARYDDKTTYVSRERIAAIADDAGISSARLMRALHDGGYLVEHKLETDKDGKVKRLFTRRCPKHRGPDYAPLKRAMLGFGHDLSRLRIKVEAVSNELSELKDPQTQDDMRSSAKKHGISEAEIDKRIAAAMSKKETELKRTKETLADVEAHAPGDDEETEDAVLSALIKEGKKRQRQGRRRDATGRMKATLDGV